MDKEMNIDCDAKPLGKTEFVGTMNASENNLVENKKISNEFANKQSDEESEIETCVDKRDEGDSGEILWCSKFQELKEHKQKHGDCNILERHPRLGSWVYTQRKNYKRNKLPKDRLSRLRGVGFQFKVKFTNEEVSLSINCIAIFWIF